MPGTFNNTSIVLVHPDDAAKCKAVLRVKKDVYNNEYTLKRVREKTRERRERFLIFY
jgi:hypothetical protein